MVAADSAGMHSVLRDRPGAVVRRAVTAAVLICGAPAFTGSALGAAADSRSTADPAAAAATIKLTLPPTAPPPARHAGPPIPGWVPALGIGFTTSLLAGAIASGVLARVQRDELLQGCGMTDDGCTPVQIAEAKSWARIANVLWLATAVVGTGTAVAVYVDARSVGFARTWSF